MAGAFHLFKREIWYYLSCVSWLSKTQPFKKLFHMWLKFHEYKLVGKAFEILYRMSGSSTCHFVHFVKICMCVVCVLTSIDNCLIIVLLIMWLLSVIYILYQHLFRTYLILPILPSHVKKWQKIHFCVKMYDLKI